MIEDSRFIRCKKCGMNWNSPYHNEFRCNLEYEEKENKRWNVKYVVYQYNGMKIWTYHKIHYVQIVGKTVIVQDLTNYEIPNNS